MMNIKQEDKLSARRPLKVRKAGFASACARWLANKNVTPNQISVGSVGFALLAALCLILTPSFAGNEAAGFSWLMPVLAATFIQCRLLCNLFDGMVAVEGGKSTPAGELFNDIPDRIADPLILVAAGFAISHMPLGAPLGWLAGLLAVMTAYMRTLAASIGAPVDFQGPMAKQHRMALMTAALVITAFETLFWPFGVSLYIALLVCVAGCLITLARRALAAYRFLENTVQD